MPQAEDSITHPTCASTWIKSVHSHIIPITHSLTLNLNLTLISRTRLYCGFRDSKNAEIVRSECVIHVKEDHY